MTIGVLRIYFIFLENSGLNKAWTKLPKRTCEESQLEKIKTEYFQTHRAVDVV